MPTFPNGTVVVARYPDTDEFFNADVVGFQKGKYTLMFDGEQERDEKGQLKTMDVDKRFVMDAKLWMGRHGD
jgi:SGF29 tudor-like domain